MKTRAIGAILLAAMMGAAATGFAAEKAVRKVDLGKLEYEANCASCHGAGGKGDGVLKPYLTKSATDLTVLARQNGGVFPMNRVYEVIDGRTDVKAHGGRDMPVWGRDYNVKAAEYYMDVPYDPDAYVRGKILSLIDYLYRMQAK